jgi:hypothetical protein
MSRLFISSLDPNAKKCSNSSNSQKTFGARWQEATKVRFNPMLEANIEFNIFDYRFISPFKQAKAWITQKLFRRINKDVVLSPDNEYLLLNETIDTSLMSSSFKALDEKMVDSIANGLNVYAHKFRKMGFDTILLSIIPNPVSVLFPKMGDYNNLASRVMNHPEIKMPVIDVLNDLRSAPFSTYFKSDSHWNENGFSIWQTRTNEVLHQIVPKK